jgi:hypothetical protein
VAAGAAATAFVAVPALNSGVTEIFVDVVDSASALLAMTTLCSCSCSPSPPSSCVLHPLAAAKLAASAIIDTA